MITVSQVTKRYGHVVALDSVSLSILPGEHVAFVGANGSGKTTLLRSILGLLRVEGRITVGGVDVATEPQIALRSVAYIPQIAPPIDAPVREVVRAHAALRDRRDDVTWERAKRLGLDPSLARTKRFNELSGGMKQKLLAAMAFACEAPILVCDEPTANLDGDARASFFEQLSERPKSSIVILCSHRIEEVRQTVRRIVELGEGKIVRDAPLEDILRDLKAFRVEIVLREGAAAAEALIRARGFERSGHNRYSAHIAQHQKVQLVTRALSDVGDDILDLSVTPVDDLVVASRTSEPRLRRVGA